MNHKLLWLPLFIWLEPNIIFHELFYAFLFFMVIIVGTVFAKWVARVQEEIDNEINKVIIEIRVEDDWIDEYPRNGKEDR